MYQVGEGRLKTGYLFLKTVYRMHLGTYLHFGLDNTRYLVKEKERFQVTV
jgi:hypothetical protein